MSLKPRSWFVISLALFAAGGWMWHYAEKVRLNQEHTETATPSPAPPAHPPVIKAVGTNSSASRKELSGEQYAGDGKAVVAQQSRHYSAQCVD